MSKKAEGEERDGVALTNLDQPLFEDAGATKRDLVDYLDAVRDQILPRLAGRPLSVLRIRPGQPSFMQKNVPKYTPDFVRTVKIWAEASKREVSYALCDDRKTLLWFANQRAIEYHVPLVRDGQWEFMVMDIDPPQIDRPSPDAFGMAVAAAKLVRQALADSGLAGVVKTSGAKGVHIFVPLAPDQPVEDIAAATRALAARAERIDPAVATTAYVKDEREGKVFLDSTRAGGATVAATYSPRIRPGLPVSFPVDWDDLDNITPADFTIHNAPALLDGRDPWAERMPPPHTLGADLIAEGHTIPIARVVAMHEGKRRKRLGS